MANEDVWRQALQISRILSQCGLNVHNAPFWAFRRARDLVADHGEDGTIEILRGELAARI